MQNLNPRSSKVHIFSQIFSLKGDPTYADEILVCEGKEIPCHRVILAARSILFKNIFSNKNFKEGKTQRISFNKMKLSLGSDAELHLHRQLWQQQHWPAWAPDQRRHVSDATTGQDVWTKNAWTADSGQCCPAVSLCFPASIYCKKSLQANKKIHLSKFWSSDQNEELAGGVARSWCHDGHHSVLQPGVEDKTEHPLNSPRPGSFIFVNLAIDHFEFLWIY